MLDYTSKRLLDKLLNKVWPADPGIKSPVEVWTLFIKKNEACDIDLFIQITSVFYMCIKIICFLVGSFVELVRYVFTIPVVLNRLCQDPLEKFFGQQRQRGRTHENSNVMGFIKNTHALRVINSTCF